MLRLCSIASSLKITHVADFFARRWMQCILYGTSLIHDITLQFSFLSRYLFATRMVVMI